MEAQIVYIAAALMLIGTLIGFSIRLNKKQEDDILKKL